METKLAPKELRLSLIRQLTRNYRSLLIGSVCLTAGLFLLGNAAPRFFLFPFEAMLVITAFVTGGFYPIIRMTKLEEYIKTLEPKQEIENLK